MENLFDALAIRFTRPAHCAAALGMSRQAYQQAQRRRHLSESKAMLAAELLNITPSDALLINASAKNAPSPKDHPAPNLPPDGTEIMPTNTNYAHLKDTKKSAQCATLKNVHSITSKSQNDQIDLIRWCFAVADVRADWGRFNYYVSRWRVPEKIAFAKASGTFDDLVSKCPPIDPAWIRFVPGAIAEYEAFIAPRKKAEPKPRPSSITTRPARKRTARAA